MARRMSLGVLTGSIGLLVAVIPAMGDGVKDVAVKGEIVDTFCFVTMGARGASHKQCAIDCAKAGIPSGIVEEGSGKLYVLLPNKDETALPPSVTAKMGETATVTGEVYSSGGSQFLKVESVS